MSFISNQRQDNITQITQPRETESLANGWSTVAVLRFTSDRGRPFPRAMALTQSPLSGFAPRFPSQTADGRDRATLMPA